MSNTAAAGSVWSGLGQRGTPNAEPDGELDEVDREDFDHRIVPAAAAQAAATADAASSPFTAWRTAGTGTSQDAPAESATRKEKPMTEKTGTAPRNLQRRLAQVLATGGNMTHAEIAAKLPDLSSKQLSQCLFQITGNGRARRADKADGGRAYELTARGEKWIATAQPEQAAPPKRLRAAKVPAKAPAKVPAKRAKPGRKAALQRAARAPRADKPPTLAARTSDPLAARSFRAAIFTDGAFHLAKGGKEIDLTPAEHKELLRYMDRMAVEEAA